MSSNRQLAAVMFTDIVGYTALMGADEEKAFAFLRKNRLLHKPVIEEFGGRWIKELGDGVLVSFTTVSNAVYAGIKLQEACHRENEFSLRVGIHQGEVIFEEDDIFGDAVNIAARIQALAPIGGIWVSETVYHNVANKPGIEAKFVKAEILKNVKEPVRIYEIKRPGAAFSELPSIPRRVGPLTRWGHKRTKMPFYLIGGAFLLLISGYFIMDRLPGTSQEESVVQATEEIEKSIAVLPFVNMSNDREQEYFSDGLSEELLNLLAKIPDLKVIARTSSFSFKGKNQDVRTIGEKLGVAHILQGSIRKDDNRIRVNAQLIRASDGSHLWSETYNRNLENIFQMQDDIAQAVVNELKIKLSVLPSQEMYTSASPEVHSLILQGKFFHEKMDKESVAKALEFYHRALALDSLNARAWALAAAAYGRQSFQNYVDPREGYEKEREAAYKAIDINNSLAAGHTALAAVKMYYDFDWTGAEAEYRKALHLEPNSADALRDMGNLQRTLGAWEEAVHLTEKSLVLDPLKPLTHLTQGNNLTYAGRLEEAIDFYQKTLELDPMFQRAHMYLGRTYLLQGKSELALLEMQQENDENFRKFGMALVYHQLGRKEEADKALKDYIATFQDDWPYQVAELYAFRGETDAAFAWLEKAYVRRDSWLIWVKGDPLLKSLRSDPRFNSFLDKMNLPLYKEGQ